MDANGLLGELFVGRVHIVIFFLNKLFWCLSFNMGFCSACGSPDNCACGKCGERYCGRQCQLNSWPTHKTVCQHRCVAFKVISSELDAYLGIPSNCEINISHNCDKIFMGGVFFAFIRPAEIPATLIFPDKYMRRIDTNVADAQKKTKKIDLTVADATGGYPIMFEVPRNLFGTKPFVVQ